jgi:hypothetical protein
MAHYAALGFRAHTPIFIFRLFGADNGRGSRNRAVSVWEELRTKIRALSDCAFYGYARVSTDGQSVTAQVAALRQHGAGKVFREVASEPRLIGRSFGAYSTNSTPATC